MLKTTCPQCGAPIEFTNKASLFATCVTCGSSLLREDINLKNLGKMAELQDDGSVIQIGVTGTHDARDFRVVGRIQRGYARGFWNDWFVAFADGEAAWLSEAMGFYSILYDAKPDAALPSWERMELGETISIGGGTFWIKSILKGECAGAEGELPYAVPSHEPGVFVDLAAESYGCASISYVGSTLRTIAGTHEEFGALNLKGIVRPEGW